MIFNNRNIIPDSTRNWGDLVPYYIIKHFSKTTKLAELDVFNVKHFSNIHKIYSTGSVMHFTKKGCIVWGTGCIDHDHIGHVPDKIYSVRGPNTRNELQKRGIACPEVYGDPALLYPKIYNPSIEKKYKWGIIPHYIEFDQQPHVHMIKNLEEQGFFVIDICSGEDEFINQLLQVENVLSSSLHGLIAADAYGIPNARVNISNRLHGHHFKFIDYCLSVNRKIDYGLQLTGTTSLEEIEKLHLNESIEIDLDRLLEVAPWNDDSYKHLFY